MLSSELNYPDRSIFRTHGIVSNLSAALEGIVLSYFSVFGENSQGALA